MARTCQKHLVECNCVLPQYRKMRKPIFHKFIVFSVLESDTVVPKYAQCNNCGAVHRVYDICKSEIIPGKDELRSVGSIDEIRLFIPTDLVSLLDLYSCELPIWEHVKFSLDESRWGERIILTRETVKDETTGKILTIAGPNRFTLEDYITREIVG